MVLVKRKKRTEKGAIWIWKVPELENNNRRRQPASASGGGAEAGGGNEAAGLFL